MTHNQGPKYLKTIIICLSLLLLLGGLARAAQAQGDAADWLAFGSGDTARRRQSRCSRRTRTASLYALMRTASKSCRFKLGVKLF